MTTIKNLKTGETITRDFAEQQLVECKRDGFEVIPQIHGLKKAVGEYQRYNDGRRFWSNLMYDTEDGKIWCDTFTNSESWREYHSDSIRRIDVDVMDASGAVTMATVREYIAKTLQKEMS